jgi:hypothetical protein
MISSDYFLNSAFRTYVVFLLFISPTFLFVLCYDFPYCTCPVLHFFVYLLSVFVQDTYWAFFVVVCPCAMCLLEIYKIVCSCRDCFFCKFKSKINKEKERVKNTQRTVWQNEKIYLLYK